MSPKKNNELEEIKQASRTTTILGASKEDASENNYDAHGMIEAMKAEMREEFEARLSKFKNDSTQQAPGTAIRKRTKEKIVRFREVEIDGEVIGLCVGLTNVKTVKDPTDNKRELGYCDLEVLNPKTGKVVKIAKHEYLNFLEGSPQVETKVVREIVSEPRVVTDKGKGGGGIDFIRNYDGSPTNEEIEFAVTFVDREYVLEVLSGTFTGETFQAGAEKGFAANI